MFAKAAEVVQRWNYDEVNINVREGKDGKERNTHNGLSLFVCVGIV